MQAIYNSIGFFFSKFGGLFYRLAKLMWHCRKKMDALCYQNCRMPWTPGYLEAKESFLKQSLGDEILLDAFCMGGDIPSGYGQSFDERTIELPWFLANLGKFADGHKLNLLDAGSACNHLFYLPMITRFADMTIITFSPENVCGNELGVSYNYGDIRDMPYKSEMFDAVVSISTMEHIGMNNEAFKDGANENKTEDLYLAVEEIHRVLRPGGLFFMTVPFGEYNNYGTFQQFDSSLLKKCREKFNPAESNEQFYLCDSAGWRIVKEQDCIDIQYSFDPQRLGIAAASAVACCVWRK